MITDYSDIKLSDIKDDSLAHHGIKGQKWGVSNGPPYPLKPEVHNRVVRGDNKPTGASKPSGSSNRAVKEFDFSKTIERLSNTKEEETYRKLAKKLDAERKPDEKIKTIIEQQRKDYRGLGDIYLTGKTLYKETKQKRRLVTADDLKEEVIESPKMIGESYKRRQKEISDNVENGYYNGGVIYVKDKFGNQLVSEPGRDHNCARCTLGIVASMLGYDNLTATKADGGIDFNLEFPKFISGSSVTEHHVPYSYGNLDSKKLSALEKGVNPPNGSFGYIGIEWTRSSYKDILYDPNVSIGGHAMAWSKNNGKITVYDGQSSTIYKSLGEAAKELNFQQMDLFSIDEPEKASLNFDYVAETGILEPLKTENKYTQGEYLFERKAKKKGN